MEWVLWRVVERVVGTCMLYPLWDAMICNHVLDCGNKQRPLVCVGTSAGAPCLPPWGGGFGTRPWWLALLACGGAYLPLAFEPSAMTSRHPYYCGHPHCRGHPPSWVGIQNASSAHGVLPWRPDQCPVCGHHEDPRLGGAHLGGGGGHNPNTSFFAFAFWVPWLLLRFKSLSRYAANPLGSTTSTQGM